MSVTTLKLGLDPGEHVVHFYRDDAQLTGTIGAHIAGALGAGVVMVAIASCGHLEALEGELTAAGIDLGAALRSRRLILLDARAMLAKLLVDGRVDRDAFEREVGTVIRAAREGGSPVAAYGEMVDLLWQAGDLGSAIELEHFWNELIAELQFSLLCAYRSEAVAAPEHALREICHVHSAVSREFSPERDAPRAARRFVEEALEHWGYRSSLVDDARLLVSELVTNAVIHARSRLSVSIRSGRPSVRLSVRDDSPRPPTLRAPAPNTASGRGLQIVAAVSRNWGVEATRDGKTVWVEV